MRAGSSALFATSAQVGPTPTAQSAAITAVSNLSILVHPGRWRGSLAGCSAGSNVRLGASAAPGRLAQAQARRGRHEEGSAQSRRRPLARGLAARPAAPGSAGRELTGQGFGLIIASG